jgi:hypothetical protein
LRRNLTISMAAVVAIATISISMSVAFAADPAPAPRFTSPGTVTWDFVPVGSTGATKNVTIQNTGNADMAFREVTVRNPYEFKIVTDGCTGKTLKPGGTCVEAVTFTPTQAGTRIGGLRFADNTPCASWVTLAGSGTETAAPTRATTAACTSTEAAPGTSTTVTNSTTVIQTTTTTTPTTTTPTTAPKITAESTIGFVSKCVSKRTVKVKLTAPSGQTFTRVTMSIAGKTVKSLKGKTVSKTISLKGLPRGRFALKVAAKLSGGKSFTRIKHYITCVASK